MCFERRARRQLGERFITATCVVIGSLLLAMRVGAGDQRPLIAVVKSNTIAPYEAAAAAVVNVLRENSIAPEVLTFDLGGQATVADAVWEQVQAAHPQLVMTVGSLATAEMLRRPVLVPTVFAMVLYSQESGFTRHSSGRVTGASLDIPLDVQFQYLRRLLPNASRVGVLYDAGETGGVVAAARDAATAHGFTLIAEPVPNASRAVAALNALMEQVDVVWAVADSHVFTAQSTPALILATLRRGVPLFGLSLAQVRAGALAALDCEPADIGTQSAELALRILDGEEPGRLPVTTPRRVRLGLNLRTAQHIGVEISRTLEAEASEVVR
jgi:putative ABC transport system substrate-binding protein